MAAILGQRTAKTEHTGNEADCKRGELLLPQGACHHHCSIILRRCLRSLKDAKLHTSFGINNPPLKLSMAESNEAQPQQSEQVCNFFRKPSKGKNIWKRTAVEEGEDEDGDSKVASSVVYSKKKQTMADNKLHFSSGPSQQSRTSDYEVEKTKANIFEYESSKEIQVHDDSKATATLETETDFSRDARSIRERILKQAEEALKRENKSNSEEKLYKGIHGYTDYKAGFRREQTVASEKAGGSHGPLRASAHIRVSARFDYQPDICKDYKETGYCGYGDSCKFMHDRGDYKSGWQLEKEWDEKEKARAKKMAMGLKDDDDERDPEASDEDDDNALPFAGNLL